MGFSMCSKKTDGESLKRAQTACIQSVRGFLPEKANLVKTLDSTVETAALVPKYKDLPTEWAQVKAKPFIADGVDQKLEAIVSDSTLSNAEGDNRITGILEPTSFWKETCSVELKNAIQKCADKFEFDSSDWKRATTGWANGRHFSVPTKNRFVPSLKKLRLERPFRNEAAKMSAETSALFYRRAVARIERRHCRWTS